MHLQLLCGLCQRGGQLLPRGLLRKSAPVRCIRMRVAVL